MVREEVYSLFDGERDYQDIKWGHKDNSKISVSEWISYIEYQLSKAKYNIYHLDKIGALEEIRKVGALAVVCLENNDCPKRIFEKSEDIFMNDINEGDE